MCTLLSIRNLIYDYPLIVAFNRDEKLDRESSEPCVLKDLSTTKIIGARDLKKGGTWLAIKASSKEIDPLIVAVTNETDEFDSSLKTRGKLVLEGFNQDNISIDSYKRNFLKKIKCNNYNKFNLVAISKYMTYFCHGLGQRKPLIRYSKRDVNVICSNHFSLKSNIKKHYLANKLKNLNLYLDSYMPNIDDVKDYMHLTLSAHSCKKSDSNLDSQICVHGDDYGTVSTTIVAFSRTGLYNKYWYGTGNPCSSELKDYSHLF